MEREMYIRRMIPLAEVPLTRGKRTNKRQEAVAAHELNHWDVLESAGGKGGRLTVRHGPDYLGLTTPGGSLNPEQMKVAFMAGTVSTPYGPAEGYSSDLFKALWLEWRLGGRSVQSARKECKRDTAS